MSRPVGIYTRKVINLAKRMKREGASNADIAAAIGTTADSVKVRLSQLGAHEGRNDNGYLGAYVTPPIEQRMREEAVRRKTTLSALIRSILVRVALDDLFAAVLDAD